MNCVVFRVTVVLLVEGIIKGLVRAGEGEGLVGIFPGHFFLPEVNNRRVLGAEEESLRISLQLLVLVFMERDEVCTGVLGWAVEKGGEKVPGEEIVVFGQPGVHGKYLRGKYN